MALAPGAAERLRRLRQEMARADVDLVLVTPGANLRYLLGLDLMYDERPTALFVGREELRLLVPSLNATQAAAIPGLALLAWDDDRGPRSAIEAAAGSVGRVRLAAVDATARADTLVPLLDVVAPERLILASEVLAPLRLRKSDEEIARLQAAASQADRVMAAALEACRAGATEREIGALVESAFRAGGASAIDFAIVASGPNGAIPHHHTGPRVLEAGDPVIVDIGATLSGYKSDITRMAHLGEPPPAFLGVYDAVRMANDRARAAVRPGARASEVDHAARSTLAARGLAAHFVHRTGHGLGLDTHEPPWISATSDTVLEPGMVFSIEPGVYLTGRFGVRIEDIVVVTDDGSRTLTESPHDIVVR